MAMVPVTHQVKTNTGYLQDTMEEEVEEEVEVTTDY